MPATTAKPKPAEANDGSYAGDVLAAFDALEAAAPRCTNAEPGTFNHECGRPAGWIGTTATGFRSPFCGECKADGYEARSCVTWEHA